MFDTTPGEGGGAAATQPSASVPASETPIGTGTAEGAATALAPDPAIPPTIDSGEPTPPAPLTTEPANQPVPDAGVNEPPPAAEPTEEEIAAQLQAVVDDPATPQFARAKIKESLDYAARLRTSRDEALTRVSAIDGKEAVDPAELTRMREAEQRVFALSSIAATPQEMDAAIKDLNPRVYENLRSHFAWQALENADGTPNLNNLQAIVDKFAGEPGKVDAKDVLQAVSALKTGLITPDALNAFNTPEEYEAWQRQQEKESALTQREQQIKANAEFQESQIRSQEVSNVIGGPLMQEVGTIADPLIQKFGLAPQAGEPTVAVDFKQDVEAEIANLVNSAVTRIPQFGEIKKAIDILSKADPNRPVDAQTAIAEIQAYAQHPQFKLAAAGAMSELRNQIEKTVSKAAVRYGLMMAGYAQQNSKPQTAPPVIGAASQTANLPKLTEADLAKLSAAERQEMRNNALSEGFRTLNPPYGAGRQIG